MDHWISTDLVQAQLKVYSVRQPSETLPESILWQLPHYYWSDRSILASPCSSISVHPLSNRHVAGTAPQVRANFENIVHSWTFVDLAVPDDLIDPAAFRRAYYRARPQVMLRQSLGPNLKTQLSFSKANRGHSAAGPLAEDDEWRIGNRVDQGFGKVFGISSVPPLALEQIANRQPARAIKGLQTSKSLLRISASPIDNHNSFSGAISLQPLARDLDLEEIFSKQRRLGAWSLQTPQSWRLLSSEPALAAPDLLAPAVSKIMAIYERAPRAILLAYSQETSFHLPKVDLSSSSSRG
ncbi:hypothetical protein C8J56DRAFT_1063154 [Mycena floridula]|nr:hypothetical protein C8J56DRAFT_1063154 [Mycena floridula]